MANVQMLGPEGRENWFGNATRSWGRAWIGQKRFFGRVAKLPSKDEKATGKKNREVLFNAQREYDLHVKNRKKHFDALRRNKTGKIEDEDSIYVGYATKPRSGGNDRGRLFPSNKTIRASTAPSGLRVRHYKNGTAVLAHQILSDRLTIDFYRR